MSLNTFHVPFHFTSAAAAAPNTTELFEVHRRHADRSIDRSIGTQHTKALLERSKSRAVCFPVAPAATHPDRPLTDQSAQRRSIPNKPKQTINNGGRCVAANLHRHPNMANPTCSCLAAISNMVVQSFCWSR